MQHVGNNSSHKFNGKAITKSVLVVRVKQITHGPSLAGSNVFLHGVPSAKRSVESVPRPPVL